MCGKKCSGAHNRTLAGASGKATIWAYHRGHRSPHYHVKPLIEAFILQQKGYQEERRRMSSGCAQRPL